MNQTAVIITAVLSFVITVGLGKLFIPFLRKLKFGQTILEIGPTWHKEKQGTPTMGGIMFIIGILIAAIVGLVLLMAGGNVSLQYGSEWYKVFGVLVMSLGFGTIGFIDDYVKVVKKQNLGLTAGQKLILQILVAVCYLLMNVMSGDKGTIFIIPFIGQIDFGIFYYVIGIFIIIAMVNAVNLTDGVDGLASMVTFFVSVGLLFMAGYLNNQQGVVLSAALGGGCLGFLMWNFYPAKVFMGDTGSMFLGGMVTAIAFYLGFPFLLPIFGIIYVIETLSVVLQVISFKTTGKRIFKMSPIHHHFEMSGYTEIKINLLFSGVTILGVVASILLIQNL